MFLIRGIIAIVFLQLMTLPAVADIHCGEPVGELASIQGQAQVRQTGKTGWSTVGMGDRFCPGDVLRIGSGGRAAVVLANETVLRLDQNSTITFGAPDRGPLVLRLLNGVLHIFSHRPRSLLIATPYVNGNVEGTEFLVTVKEEKTEITVFSGLVVASNELGRLAIADGQSVVVRAGTAPSYATVVKPRDAVQWTLYYPAILADAVTGPDDGAIERVGRAASLLTVGRVDEARDLCDRVLAEEPGTNEALALLSIIELVQNNKQAATELAQQAIGADPRSAAAGLALSYTRQADFDIPGALRVLEETAGYNPDNAQVKARLAEMLLATGQLDEAVATAREAVARDPNIGLTRVILGFAHLARIETELAKQSFRQAIALDQALPLARLGLGLAEIRDGDFARGRAAIELAAALDPSNALIRSYLGKAYFEERRDAGAQRQYRIAKKLDPADPTPWFYDAIRKQTINRPVEALHDLQQSMALNNRRAVYRSRFLLDDDLAARSASLGRIYQDLGFEQLALAQGWKSLTDNPANYSAHRFLADSYHALPRHEIARVSELLQSQLLQPLNITPVQPHLAESNLAILEGAGPAYGSLNEYNPLFLRNRLSLQASGMAGSDSSYGDELTHAAVWNNISYSLGQFHYQSDGIRENNDQRTNLFNAYLQTMLSPQSSLMSEFRYRKKTFGDLTLRFDPDDYCTTIDQSDEINSLRIGARHDLQPNSTLLGTAIISSTDGSATGIEEFGAVIDIANSSENIMAEVQHLWGGHRLRLQSGAGYLVADETDSIHLSFPIDDLIEEDSTTRHFNLYGYAQIDLTDDLSATIGLSGDLLDSSIKDRESLNPKLGIAWEPLHGTILRGAVFKTVQRRLIYAQTVEPTHIAGFNQFFDDFAATASWTYGLGADQVFSDNWFGGLQFFHRSLDVPFTAIGPDGVMEQIEDDWQEDVGSAYLYWAPCPWSTLGLEYYYERFSHDRWEGPQGIKELTTHRITPKIHFFHSSGFSAKLQASYLDQQGDFGWTFTGFTSDSDHFWLIDLSLGYRLPKRYGMISLEVKNLFDETFRFLDTDPANPRFLPQRQIMIRLTVSW